MKSIYVESLRDGESLQGQTFAVFEVTRATDKYNNEYMDLLVGDRTGKLKAKIWSDTLPKVNTKLIKIGKVVALDARVEDYKGNLQLNVSGVHQVDETKVDEYIQSSTLNPEEMFAELKSVIDSIQNQDILAMFNSMLQDQDFVRKVKYWPAATSYHHEFRSGLLQHILEGLALANGVERFYPTLDFDVVKAGIILHDLGKLEELDASGFATRYTVKGSILGHIYIGTEIIDRFFPHNGSEKVKMHLKHIVLSHHGEKEKGSPVLPATPEAVLVHSVDAASAITRMAADAIEGNQDDFGMTPFVPHLQRWMWADSQAKSDDLSEEAIVYPEE